MRRILTSLLVIGIVGVAAFGASRAFFSDTETSSGNVLAAGAIDLLVGNTSYVTDEDGKLVASPSTTWSLRDLTVEKFFNFFDLKPGDEGENTIEIQVNNNDAYVCANVQFPSNGDLENGLTEPELVLSDDDSEGELDENLYFVFWADDGDNVYEDETILEQGLASNITLGGGTLAIAESPSPLAGGSTYSLGSYYCYGGPPVSQNLPDGTTGPNDRGSGFTCNGSAVSNNSQTDMLIGDISFYAVQARNNDGFKCSDVNTWPNPVGIKVGANLAAYSAPISCDVTVIDSESIQTAITSGSVPVNGTVCVAESYNMAGDDSPIRISKNGVTVAALVRGVDLDVPVVLDNPGTTITGFDGVIAQAESGSEVAAFYIDGDADNAEISFNTVRNAGAQAVLTETSTTLTGALIRHNQFDGALTRNIFLNPSRNMVVEYNDLLGDGVGVANDEPHSNTLRYNVFSGNSEAVGYLDDVVSVATSNNGQLSVVFNNIYNPGEVNNYSTPLGNDSVLNATNNWWGGDGSADQTNQSGGASGTINTAPEASSAYSEY